MPQQVERTLFVVIFEGRTGSSELIARLNSHPDIQAYPEILAPLCGPDISDVHRWTAVRNVLQALYDGRTIETFYEAYSKQGAEHCGLPVRGLKTRLDDRRDLAWFQRMGKMNNFYVVEPHRFMELAAEYDVRVIRLRRRNLLKHAVSWIRAVQLSSEQGKWNIPFDEADFGPTVIPLDILKYTLSWLEDSTDRHDAAYSAYSGRKFSIEYEDLLVRWNSLRPELLEFLGVRDFELRSFHKKVTDDDLSKAVLNYEEIMSFVRGR